MDIALYLGLIVLFWCSLIALIDRLWLSRIADGAGRTTLQIVSVLIPLGFMINRVLIVKVWADQLEAGPVPVIGESIALGATLLGCLGVRWMMRHPSPWLLSRPTRHWVLLTVLLLGAIGAMAIRFNNHLHQQLAIQKEFLQSQVNHPGGTAIPEQEDAGPYYQKIVQAFPQEPSGGKLRAVELEGTNTRLYEQYVLTLQPQIQLAREASRRRVNFFVAAVEGHRYRLEEPPIFAGRLLSISTRGLMYKGKLDEAVQEYQNLQSIVSQIEAVHQHDKLGVLTQLLDMRNRACLTLLPGIQTEPQLDALAPHMPDLRKQLKDAIQFASLEHRLANIITIQSSTAQPNQSWRTPVWLNREWMILNRSTDQATQIALEISDLPVVVGLNRLGSRLIFYNRGVRFDSPQREARSILDRGVVLGNAATAQAQCNAVILAVAATKYRLDHGQYPEKTDQLVPAYLPVIPEDPYVPGQPMKMFRTSAGRLVIYSVDEDQVDDKGDVLMTSISRSQPADVGYILDRPLSIPATGEK